MSSRGMCSINLMAAHKAEKKYEAGKLYGKEEAMQRQLRAILNKLTPRNFEKLFAQVLDVGIDDADSLACFVSQVFEKALMEPTYCALYAQLCYHAGNELPVFSNDYKRISFRRLLLDKCQEEFERGKRCESNTTRGQGGEEREHERLKARRRYLGCIRLIGELYRNRMLTERIVHECIRKLLQQFEIPDEEDIEGLCVLMSTIGMVLDHPKAREHMDTYFDVMLKLSTSLRLSSRIRFMLMDAIDLRKNKWQQRRRGDILAPWMVLHKADERYVVGEVFEKEELKQRKFRAILNKLTYQNFEILLEQVLEIGIDNVVTLNGFVSQIYEKSLIERTHCEVYADLCYCLSRMLPDFSKGYERVTFKKLLANKCQEGFERREREQFKGSKIEAITSSEINIEEKIKLHKRFQGNIHLIGELSKSKMLPAKIVHHCIQVLFEGYPKSDEENIEALCTLVTTVGELLDHPISKKLTDIYFDKMRKLSTNHNLSSRIRFLLMDAIDLRNNEWIERRNVERPMTVDKVLRNKGHKHPTPYHRWEHGPVATFVDGQTLSYNLRDKSSHIPYRFSGEQYNKRSPRYCATDHILDRSATNRAENTIAAGLIQGPFGGSQRAYSEAKLFSNGELQEKSSTMRRVSFREGSSMINISSSSSNNDEEDHELNYRSCLDAEGNREEKRDVEKDCFILDSDSYQNLTVYASNLFLSDHQDEDVVVIAEQGQVACRDYPHSRHLCVKYPFNKTDHENYCSQCYCYVCDAVAPCEYWQGTVGHCHASDKEMKWNELRKSRRTI